MDWQFIKNLLFGIFYNSNSLIKCLPTYLSIIPIFLLLFPKLGDKIKWLSIVRNHAIPIIMGFILISVILTSYSLYKNKLPNFATPDELTQSILRNKDIRLTDLTREDFRIRNRTFDNCHIYGPAIISIGSGTMLIQNTFAGVLPESALIETTNKLISGAISLDGCIVKNCTFYKISFIGDSELIAKIKAGFIYND